MSRVERRLAKKGGGAQDSFNEALRLHQSGHYAEAERLYRQILARDPRHADSLHLLGVLAYQRGEPLSAIDLIGQAIAITDAVPFFHNNRGLALAALGRIDEATAHYERALTLKADYVEALSNLGNLRLMQGRAEDAIGLHKRALAHNPDYAEGQMNLGNALREQGKAGEAITRYERALALRPDYAEAMNNLGNALHDLGKLADARASYERAFAVRPDFAEACANLGNVLHEMGELDAAATHLERAISLRRDYGEAHNGLGLVLDKKGEYANAIACFERALALQPEDVEILNNLGAALQNIGRFDDAIARYERALALRPDYGEARKNLGGALHARAGERSGALLRERMREASHSGVRGQYESLPFPARDPEGERYVRYVTPPDILAKVNQYCFAGGRDFGKGLRVLVAGCGTGDSVMWLGEQLRHTPSDIVALDLSSASLSIAEARAKMRRLTNIRFVNASLLEAPQLGLDAFDYITCLGVLHHLPDPEAGLRALEAMLAPDGGMALMLYGLPGRAHIYAMQEVLRGATAGIDDREQKLALARDILAHLPATNPFRLCEGWENIQAAYLKDDTNLWDTLLHDQDRAYTASGVRDFLSGAGLHLQAFGTYKAAPATCSLQYDLDLYIGNPDERVRLARLPQPQREDMAEALDGSLALHTFYATRVANAALDPAEPEAILSAMSEFGGHALAHAIEPGAKLPVLLRNGRTITYEPSPQTQRFLAAIDGRRSNVEIAQSLGVALAEIAPELRIPAALHWLVARRTGGTAFAPIPMHGKFALPLRPEEPVLLVEAPL
ncbi:MAG TPA: tetratricopeptide repeat protein [Stellaceae bacterium]|jgi:tetratricopeptide (TPR) repeat protein